MKNIEITDREIDEITAKNFLNTALNSAELLPNIPENLTKNIAALVLNVSEPTIDRMLQEGQIQLKKSSIIAYISQQTLANRPLNLTKNRPK